MDDALQTVGRATERRLDAVEFLVIQYFVSFLKGDGDELGRTTAAARRNPLAEDIISHVEALALARSGRLQDARQMSALPVQLAQRSN